MIENPYFIDNPLNPFYALVMIATEPTSAFPHEEKACFYSFPSDCHYPRFRWYRIATPFVHRGLRTAIMFARYAGMHGKRRP